MQVKVKKEFELHTNNKAYADDILNLITINQDIDGLFVILEKYGHIFNVYFKNEFDINQYLEFNYQETKSVDYKWIREDEVKAKLNELEAKKQEEIDYWKAKCMKLLDKI